MTHTLGITIPHEARRFGYRERKPEGVTNDMRIFDLHAFSHRRRSIDISRQSPRRISSREMAMTIPQRSSGIFRSPAYATANTLPSLAKLALSEPGRSWIPLWRTPLLRPLVSSPTSSGRSTTMMRDRKSTRLNSSN